MALIKCKECAKEISDKATTCPNCGAPTNSKVFNANIDVNTKINNKQAIYIIMGIIALIIGLLLFFDGLDKTTSKTNTNNKIIYDNTSDTYTITIWEDKNTLNEL